MAVRLRHVSGLRGRRRSFRENFSWTFVGNVVFSACNWGVLCVLAKLGTPEMVGGYALAVAVSSPIVLLFGLRLRLVQATDARGQYEFGTYLGLRLLMMALALVVIAGVTWLGGYRPAAAAVIVAVGVIGAVDALSDVVYGLFQKHERMDRIATSLMIRGPLSLLAFSVAVWTTGSVFWGALSIAAAYGVTFLAWDLPHAVRERVRSRDSATVLEAAAADAPDPVASRGTWWRSQMLLLGTTAFPLGFAVLVGNLGVQVPRYFVERQLGTRELGLYTAMASIINVGLTFMTALWETATPRLARHHRRREIGAFRRLVLRLMGVGSLLGLLVILGAVIAGRPLLTLVYRSEYAERMDVFLWLMAFGALQYATGVIGYAAASMRKFWWQLSIQAGTLASTTLLCALLIPRYGLLGAAWAQLLAFTLSRFLFGAVLVRHAEPVREGSSYARSTT